MKQFKKDLPLYLNGFSVTSLFVHYDSPTSWRFSMFLLAMVTFFWYGYNKQTK